MTKTIEESIKEFKLLIPEVDKKIKEFIKSGTLNKNEIERTLDFLMNPFTENAFYKLINYYKKIDKKVAEDYEKRYKWMYED